MIEIKIKIERNPQGVATTMTSANSTATEAEIFVATALLDGIKGMLQIIMEQAGSGRMLESLISICPKCQNPVPKEKGRTIYSCPVCRQTFATAS